MRADRETLALYTEAYWENGNPAETEELPPAGPPPGETFREAMPQGNGRFGSVEMDDTGSVVSVNNPDQFDITDGDLIILAQRLAANGKLFGVEDTWVYYLENHDGRTLASFLDNTLVSDSSSTLFANTLRFGGLMIVMLCVIVWFTSSLLVRPLERNEQEQRRFISDAGHELKTPVSVIATNVELLRREIGSNRWLENITAENERSGKLIKSLLALTRAQEDSAPMEQVNLSDIAESTILPFEGVAFEKGHVLNSSVQPSLHISGEGNLQKFTMT
ncbi:MAG: HAMP domain-containing histidine kinase [Clostridia bacterium]|nr:HAMP domain-containing histidine kinase [Clostridia bacterium]